LGGGGVEPMISHLSLSSKGRGDRGRGLREVARVKTSKFPMPREAKSGGQVGGCN